MLNHDAELESLKDCLGSRYQPLIVLGEKKLGRRTVLAQDSETTDKVVIKLLTFSGGEISWDDVKLFGREAQALQSLEHPSIPKYVDYFDIDTNGAKGFALVQSYIEADSISKQIQAGRTFSEQEIGEIAQKLLEILQYLHNRLPPIVHRDIKPSNILLSHRSAHTVGELHLIDFGSVQTQGTQGNSTRTIVGSYGYMPPEQFGGRTVPASDLYALGATLIYIATGCHPADLPQENLRINFKARTHLNSSFIEYIQYLTEPSLDQRCSSASEAIESFPVNPASCDRARSGTREAREISHQPTSHSAAQTISYIDDYFCSSPSKILVQREPLGLQLRMPSRYVAIKQLDENVNEDDCGILQRQWRQMKPSARYVCILYFSITLLLLGIEFVSRYPVLIIVFFALTMLTVIVWFLFFTLEPKGTTLLIQKKSLQLKIKNVLNQDINLEQAPKITWLTNGHLLLTASDTYLVFRAPKKELLLLERMLRQACDEG